MTSKTTFTEAPTPINTIGEWLDWAKTQIKPLDAEYIAVFNFAPMNADRSWLITHLDDPIPIDILNGSDLLASATAMVKKRYAGHPMQYTLGVQLFYGREFRINENVLIPRPESEAIIDLAKELILPANAKILELGTGSGCIAITLALEFPQADVVATDISEPALDLARMNSNIHEGRVELDRGDLLLGVEPREHLHLLVANLPYVNPDWDWLDKTALGYEPEIALYPEGKNAENGLSLYHRLLDELARYTQVFPVDNLILEADPCQHEELIAMATAFGWQHHATNGYALAFKPTSVD